MCLSRTSLAPYPWGLWSWWSNRSSASNGRSICWESPARFQSWASWSDSGRTLGSPRSSRSLSSIRFSAHSDGGYCLSTPEFEEDVVTFRGRPLLADQLRRRFGLPLPVAVRFDDYTVDNVRNRVLKAALRRLLQVRFSDPSTRRRTGESLAAFHAVSDVAFPRGAIPALSPSRLTARYNTPVELARIILSGWTPELLPGHASHSGLLFRMDMLYEEYLFVMLGDRLRGRLPSELRWCHGKTLKLDDGGLVPLKPDYSIWGADGCVFVGDAKYKETDVGAGDDLYQVLAYCVAADVNEGLLVYAAATLETAHQVVHSGPELRVMAVGLDQGLDRMVAECDRVAEAICEMVKAAVW